MIPREERIHNLVENPEISVLIVGGGINGIGTFLDLALQGIDVVLVDRGDYCSGASAASSHMVHGGIRYLENGEFRLVREAVKERNRLLENAPHLAKPLATTFPIFRWFSGLLNAPLKFLRLIDKPAERGAIVIKLGMLLYDFYTRKQKTVPKHVFKNRATSINQFPLINPDIIFTGTYYDGSMPSPERIALELITDATFESDLAIPMNYMSLVSAKGNQVVLQDEIDRSTISVNPKIVINAGGPWIDQINKSIGLETEYIGGTKGSHIIVANSELRDAIGENEFFFENEDGRIVLIYPLDDKVLIGTSDIQVDDPDQAIITDEEVQYFIDMVKKVFPTIDVNPSQIVFTFSGVRPLTNSRARLTSQISRDHEIKINEPDEELHFPIYSLIGGKWTTYRAFSEQICDLVLKRIGTDRIRSTKNYKIGGGKDYPSTQVERERYISILLAQSDLDREGLETLFSRYGTKVTGMLNSFDTKNDRQLQFYADLSTAEISHIVQYEDVVHLDDFIFRRTMLGKLGCITSEGLDEIGTIIGQIQGWDDARISQEIKRVIDLLKTRHRMDFNEYIEGH